MNSFGRVALVTGAGRRVGRAIALELAAAGHDIAVHYRQSQADATETAQAVRRLGRQAALVSGDLLDPLTPGRLVGEAVAQLGGLHVLINSASSFVRQPLAETSAEDWLTAMALNAVAPALLAGAAAPHLRAGGGGRIVNLLDILADRAVRGYAAYCASKAALASITRSLAVELAPDITVNGVAPGIAEFPEHYDQATRDRLVSRVPLQRPGSPEEVARLVRFLVMEGGYLTGAIIPIDGGRSIRM